MANEKILNYSAEQINSILKKADEMPTDGNNYVHPSTHPATMIVEDATHRFMTDVEKNKLQGLDNYIHPSDANTRHVSDAEKAKWNGYDATIKALLARIEALENPPSPQAPSFCGQMEFKTVSEITYDDLNGLINKVEVSKPQTIYAHSGNTVYNKTVICAIPKGQGNIAGVVDGAGISISGAYPITEKTINVPGIGNVIYSICCNKAGQTYNSSTVVKFNLV